jgi:hypothetical protein
MATHVKSGSSAPLRAVRVKSGTVRKFSNVHSNRAVASNGPTVYDYESLGAGGWVTGLAISPDGNTRLVRTDTLGGWRWDTSTDRWEPLVHGGNMPTGHKEMDTGEGIHGLVVSNTVAFIAYRDAIFKSTDRGLTWSTSLASGPLTSPNVSGIKRYSNHMAVDPNNSNIVIYGTVNQGLYYTLNGGTNWIQVPSSTLPIGADGAATPGNSTFGILCVAIDASGNWYASPYGSGLYRSTNQGDAWTKISVDTDFVAALGMEIGPNGDIMVCGTTSATPAGIAIANIKVMRYRSSAWTNITPTGTARAWKAAAYDPNNPGRVLVQADAGYIQLSTDYGTTWVNQTRSFVAANSDVPWLAASNNLDGTQGAFTTIGGLQYDPIVSGRVWMSQGIGVWYAAPASNVIVWNAQSRGIEQLVINDAITPPGGSALGGALTVGWDRPVFLTGETTGGSKYPYRYHPTDALFGSAWHMDYSADDPHWLAASMGSHQNLDGSPSGYSSDGGLTWAAFATIPNNGTNSAWAGSMHVGAPGTAIWVSSTGRGAYRTTNSGASWSPLSMPGVTMSTINTQAYFIYRRPICSEKTAAFTNIFYAFVTSVGVFKSTDSGATWVQQCNNTQFTGTDWSWHVYLKAVPGNVGHLFLSSGFLGSPANPTLNAAFKRSTDGGVTWSTVTTINTVRAYDFGIGAPGSSYPAIYAIGYVGGVRGAYRSDDNCATWTLLSDQPRGSVDIPRNIGASKETYGKHWIALAGSGLLVGQLA